MKKITYNDYFYENIYFIGNHCDFCNKTSLHITYVKLDATEAAKKKVLLYKQTKVNEAFLFRTKLYTRGKAMYISPSYVNNNILAMNMRNFIYF